jgi:hypothetical protein
MLRRELVSITLEGRTRSLRTHLLLGNMLTFEELTRYSNEKAANPPAKH